MVPRITMVFVLWVVLTLPTPSRAEKVCGDTSKPLDAKLFTRGDCAKCAEARVFLYGESVPFREYDAENPETQRRLIEGSGGGTVPAIHICGQWFFGFEDKTKLLILRLFPYPT
jgi:glutaredoxin